MIKWLKLKIFIMITFLLLFLLIINVNVNFCLPSNNVQPFSGDSNLWNYLQKFKYFSSSSQKTTIILIENLHSLRSTLIIRKHLYEMDCPFDLYSNITIQELSSNLSYRKKPENRYRNVLVIFDISLIHSKDEDDNLDNNELWSKFNFLMQSLQIIYLKCLTCMPFLFIIFTQSHGHHEKFTNILNRLLIRLLPSTDKRFRITTVVVTNSNGTDITTTTTAIHLRPIFDGCRLFNGVFMPRTRPDFEKMNISSSWKCDLNQTMLSAAINNVSNCN